MTDQRMQRKGFFITLEGIDFSGKSTQAEMLAARLNHHGHKPVVLREPGGTDLSERVRKILLNRGDVNITGRAELLLFLAARAQLVDEVIGPAIQGGKIVLCDRFHDSTLAYQGFARGLPLDAILEMNSFATAGLIPDLTLLYDLAVEVAQQRGRGQVPTRDRLESERVDFHRRVRHGYLDLANRDPSRVKVIDADRTPEEVFQSTWKLTSKSLAEHGIDVESE